MQIISISLTNDCDGNQLNYNNDLPAMGNENYALQKPFEKDFLTVIGNAKTLTVIWPKAPDFALWHILLCKLFETIILSWNSLKCILWYLFELWDSFIKNENSVLPILIEKNFEQKIYFCLLKMSSIFF